jgi:hypothetical protein
MASVGKGDFDPHNWMFVLPMKGLNVLAAYKKEGDREELLFGFGGPMMANQGHYMVFHLMINQNQIFKNYHNGKEKTERHDSRSRQMGS